MQVLYILKIRENVAKYSPWIKNISSSWIDENQVKDLLDTILLLINGPDHIGLDGRALDEVVLEQTLLGILKYHKCGLQENTRMSISKNLQIKRMIESPR